MEVISESEETRVFKAVRSEPTEFVVALKQFLPHISKNESLVRSIQQRTELWERLEHDNILRVHRHGWRGDAFCQSMELIDGHSLRVLQERVTDKHPFPVYVAVELGIQLCRALSHIHVCRDEKGMPARVVHRGVHPGNILVGNDGVLKLADFAGSMAEAGLSRKLASRRKGGVQVYLSPEQVARRQVDHRSDQFSAAVVIAGMCIGAYPFRSSSSDSVLRKIAQARTGPMLDRVGRWASPLVPILKRALHRDPADRFKNLARFCVELEEFQETLPNRIDVARWLQEWLSQEGQPVRVGSGSSIGPGDPDPPIPFRGLSGRTLADKYQVGRLIGRGGMGEVYLAHQETLGRDVVVKVLRPPPPDAEVDLKWFEKMFLREAAAAAALSNPHTITIYDFGQTRDGILYIVMEYLEGMTIRQMVDARGPVHAKRAVHIGAQICRSLREAHMNKIVHRDLKPTNVMVLNRNADPDFVKVFDFGLVKHAVEAGEASETTLAGRTIGSPKYAAPEQLLARLDLDHRADVYAFGLTMYFMLAGRAPFSGDLRQIITSQLMDQPPPIEDVNPDANLPFGLVRLLERCLQKEPHQRFGGMDEVLQALKDLHYGSVGPTTELPQVIQPIEAETSMPSLTSLPTTDEPPPPAEPSDPAPESVSVPPIDGAAPRPWWRWVAAVAVILSLLAIGVYMGGRWNESRQGRQGLPDGTAPNITPADAEMTGGSEVIIEDGQLAVVHLIINSRPPGATVHRSGESGEQSIGTTPLEMDLDISDDERLGELVLVVRKHGFRDSTLRRSVETGELDEMVNLVVRAPAKPKPIKPPAEAETEAPDYKDDPY